MAGLILYNIPGSLGMLGSRIRFSGDSALNKLGYIAIDLSGNLPARLPVNLPEKQPGVGEG